MSTMTTNFRILICAAAVCAVAAAAPTDAQAQVTTQIDYTFNLPLAKVLPNPCTGGFTLVTGSLTASISAIQNTAFQLKTILTSSGSGKDVTATGLPLLVGALPDYAYSSDASLIATFDEGVPTYF